MQYKVYYKRKLPHFQPKRGVFFITLRLAFQLPVKFLSALDHYRASLQKTLTGSEDAASGKDVIMKKSFAYEYELYNRCESEVYISQSPSADIIMEKLLLMQEDYFYLYAFTIKPNHQHLLIQPSQREGIPVSTSEIIKNFKGSSAIKINQALGRQGQLWNREYFDRWIRDQQELVNVIQYIRNNPVQAKLGTDARDWQWTRLNPELWQED